jgi:hypothetical protein
MIVHSNAFVFSTCLPAIVSRYGFLISFFQNSYHLKKVVTINKIFSSFGPPLGA